MPGSSPTLNVGNAGRNRRRVYRFFDASTRRNEVSSGQIRTVSSVRNRMRVCDVRRQRADVFRARPQTIVRALVSDLCVVDLIPRAACLVNTCSVNGKWRSDPKLRPIDSFTRSMFAMNKRDISPARFTRPIRHDSYTQRRQPSCCGRNEIQQMTHIKLCLAVVAIGSMITAVGCDSRSNETPTTPAADTIYDHTDTSSGRSDSVQRPAQPDNTANNRGDGAPRATTPLSQSQSMEHVSLTADIRKAVMSDENLSMSAKNCKIITTSDGVVTLRGVVHSAAERDAIEAHAVRIAGGTTVVNELEIKAS
ncbi:MAG: BON domain-containing protein [Phycisphaerales bacterium]|nr:MAG: BON domain-containing protein [Phycisphaerales bacterium]